MDYLKYIILISILILVSKVYENLKLKDLNENFKEDYDFVNKYLLNKSSLANNNNKPFIWIHIDQEVNSRWWSSFYSRNSTCLNEPYKFLTIKSIINKCGDDYNICLINDESFSKIIPDWNIDLEKIGNPLREHIRKIALSKVLYHYGGMLVPSSFICFDNLKTLHNEKMFVCEFINDKYTSMQSNFFPNCKFMGCQKKCNKMKEFGDYLEMIYSQDYTNEVDFIDQANKWCYKEIMNKNITLVNGKVIGTKDKNNKEIRIDDVLTNTFIDLCPYGLGLYLPDKEILKRTNYEWFARLSAEQVLKSNTMAGKYLLISN